MLTQTVEYALRASVYLAREAPEARTTDQVAAVTRVPAAYLSKVLQALVRGGLVRSQRGVKGGFSLTRHQSDITLLDVVNSVDPIRRAGKSAYPSNMDDKSLRQLHEYIDGALASLEQILAGTSLADIAADNATTLPIHDANLTASMKTAQ